MRLPPLDAPRGPRALACRGAALATAALLALVVAGSGGLRHLDTALLGYLGATLVSTAGIAYRSSAFWRRPASAMYGRALLEALRQPRRLRVALAGAGRHLAAQELIARRSRSRWAAHMLLSLGTLASFAITVPLVCGWMRFVAIDQHAYRVVLFGLPLPGAVALDGALGFLLFHGLSIAALAVTAGATYFLLARLRRGREPGARDLAHVAPLLLLLAVALSGLALPLSRAMPGAFRVAAVVHEITVIVLLLALPFGKLGHIFLRPLQLGALVLRAPDQRRRSCTQCDADLAPAAQLAAVQQLLAARGLPFAAHPTICPACRRRAVAGTQARLLGADFHPPLTGIRPAPPRTKEAA